MRLLICICVSACAGSVAGAWGSAATMRESCKELGQVMVLRELFDCKLRPVKRP